MRTVPRLKWLWNQTVWSTGAIPPEEWRYRSLKRVHYPLVDVIYMGVGISAVHYGVPAINEYFSDTYVDLFGVGMIIASVVALIGVSFYRLWWLEVAAKCLLIGQMVTYVTALFFLTTAGDEARGFIMGVAVLAIMPLTMRLSVVSHEWQERHLMRHSNTNNDDPWSRAGQKEIRDGREILE